MFNKIRNNDKQHKTEISGEALCAQNLVKISKNMTAGKQKERNDKDIEPTSTLPLHLLSPFNISLFAHGHQNET